LKLSVFSYRFLEQLSGIIRNQDLPFHFTNDFLLEILGRDLVRCRSVSTVNLASR
jgi:hypothetical protein